MKLKFINPIHNTTQYFSSRNLLWEVEFSGYDLDSLYPELMRSNIWEASRVQGHLRFESNNNSEMINSFLSEFSNLKNEILEYVFHFDQRTFRERWFRSLEDYKRDTVMTSKIFKDTPGFSMGAHLDNSHIITQLVLNVTNNSTGTEFYDKFNSDDDMIPYYKSPPEQYKGVLFFNNASSPHGIRNVTEDRFILYSGIIY
jgi:hypothetical protein